MCVYIYIYIYVHVYVYVYVRVYISLSLSLYIYIHTRPQHNNSKIAALEASKQLHGINMLFNRVAFIFCVCPLILCALSSSCSVSYKRTTNKIAALEASNIYTKEADRQTQTNHAIERQTQKMPGQPGSRAAGQLPPT